MEKEKRITYVDIAKGFGMLLVVIGHSNPPEIMYRYIALFHMPFFFFISGFLYSEKATVKDFVKRKFLHLYIPLVFWNLLFFLCKSIMLKYRLRQIAIGILKIILTIGRDDLLGATWFLGALFVISVLYKILDYSLADKESRNSIMMMILASPGQHSCNTRTHIPTTSGQAFLYYPDIHS